MSDNGGCAITVVCNWNAFGVLFLAGFYKLSVYLKLSMALCKLLNISQPTKKLF
jgi:hypothetical protein